jgi:hypothetical protein
VAEDADCDGTLTGDDCDDADPGLNRRDRDGDGHSTCDGDCDDEQAAINPGAIDGLLADRDCVEGIVDNSLALAEHSFVGEAAGDYLGTAVSSACDVDGDGLGDLLVGAPHSDDGGSGAGKAYLILGSSLGTTVEIDLSLADHSFVGENIDDDAGISVSCAGDVDGDGLDDILVGAKKNDDGGSAAGKAYLVLGASLGSSPEIDLSLADYSFVGEASGDNSGVDVSSAGDVDGDGLDDILVGASTNDGGGSDSGRAYVVLGSSLGISPEIDLSDADHSFVGENAGDYAGFAVSTAGDVDGDGLDDILVGAYGNDDGGSFAGKAYLVLGSSLLAGTQGIDLSLADHSFVGESAMDYLGVAISSAGDVDGDGLDDILVGARHNGVGIGKAYLILGASLGTTAEIDLSLADHSFVGENIGDLAGWSVSSAGDVDGDGLGDLLVGAPHNNDGGSFAGKVYLIFGASLGGAAEIDLSLADRSFMGENAEDYVGRSISSAGDVDGDGLDDILVGAYGSDDGGSYAGKAYLILSGL